MRQLKTARAASQPSSPQRTRPLSGPIRVTAVLAPADQKGRQPPTRPEAPKPTTAQRGLTGVLFSVFRGWETKASDADSTAVVALREATTQRAAVADAIEEREKAAKDTGPMPDIHSFLRPAGIMETRYVRVLSSLCALTYNLDRLTPSSLLRRHRMKLVSSSTVCEMRLREPRQSAADVLAEADAMAADVGVISAVQADIATGAQRAAASPAMRAMARIEPLSGTSLADPSSTPAAVDGGERGLVVAAPAAAASPVDVVAASLAAAAAAASAAASAAAQGVYIAAVPYAGPLANNITSFTASVTSSLPVRGVAQQLQSAAAVGHSSAVATVATVSAALESTWGRDRRAALPKECQSPTEWFIVDDPPSHTRIFVIQGSDNLDHWRVNLTFDPVPFEDASLGIKVHRGVYETAQVLYDRFLPLVQDHLATSPFAKVAFTGHSLGGSLGTVLMLMYVRRGVLPKSAVSPVYTFGAPAVFCEGAATCGCPPGAQDPAQQQQQQKKAGAKQACTPGSGCADSNGSGGVLQALGLPDGAVRNVLMHKDIVPRAFACDYSLVADLLKRVADSFREHSCLNSSRTVMFDFIGKVMVLQPDAGASFVVGEGLHPMLPPAAGLWVLREPTPFNTVAVTLQRDAGFVRQAVQQAAGAITGLPAAASTALALTGSKPGTKSGSKSGSRKQQQFGQPVANAREAVWELMNNPHPLDTLAEPAAYGDLGAISRYHNPDNYTRALGGVLRARGASWRRLVANAGNAGMRHFAPVLDVGQYRAAAAAAQSTAAAADGSAAPSTADQPHRRASPGGKRSLRMRRSSSHGSYGGSSGNLAA